MGSVLRRLPNQYSVKQEAWPAAIPKSERAIFSARRVGCAR